MALHESVAIGVNNCKYLYGCCDVLNF